MSNWEQFQFAYQAATSEMKALVDSEVIPICVEVSLNRRQGGHLQSSATAQITRLLIGAQTIDATVSSLQQMGISDALQFIVEIQNCVKKPLGASSGLSTSDINSEQNETLGIRTMPQDMAAIRPGSEVVYQSSQIDLLSRGQGEVPDVASAASPAPRWDTDTRN